MVVEQKRVAGYDATVLTAQSGDDLVEWLKDNGYPYSPAVAAWAKPYLGGDWHFTALKLVKGEQAWLPFRLDLLIKSQRARMLSDLIFTSSRGSNDDDTYFNHYILPFDPSRFN